MPAKKKTRKKIKTAQKTETHLHLSVAQKTAVAVALLAGFSAIAAGFAAMPRNGWERPSRENPPAYNERAQEQEEKQEKTSWFRKMRSSKKEAVQIPAKQVESAPSATQQQSVTATQAPGISFGQDHNPDMQQLLTGQENVQLFTVHMKPTGEDVIVEELTFRVKSLTAMPADLGDMLKNLKLKYDSLHIASAAGTDSNGSFTFSNLNITLDKGKTSFFNLYTDVLDSVMIDPTNLKQPFSVELDTAFSIPVIKGADTLQDTVIEGSSESRSFQVSRSYVMQSFSSTPGQTSPAGVTSKQSDQTIAIVDITSKSFNGYDSDIADFHIKRTSSETSSSTAMMRVYKDQVDTSNLLAEKEVSWDEKLITFDDASFTDFTVADSTTRKLYITLNTMIPFISTNDKICVELSPYMSWTDGVKLYNKTHIIDGAPRCLQY